MFEKIFCSSPWLHMRIRPDGAFGFCRWGSQWREDYNIRTHSVEEYFQTHLAPIRHSLLEGTKISNCDKCYVMEEHGKISGRQRQLLKTGIMTNHFIPSLNSSPFLPAFQYSEKHQGCTNLLPVDWQIDLGNHCNTACVMCTPRYSSRLSTEFQKIGLISDEKLWNSAWTNDDKLLEKFCDGLVKGPAPVYLHFLGGETLIIPAFKKILERLIDVGMTSPTIGFTTNLTVWPTEVIEQLLKFKTLNVGLSIESLHEVNHYIRWPSNQKTVLENLKKWIEISKKYNHPVQLRLTPSALSIIHVADLYQFAWDQGVGIETCNFITEPKCLSLKVLPPDIRNLAIQRLEKFLEGKSAINQQVVNTRNPHTIDQQVLQDAQSYINFLRDTEEDQFGAQQLVEYLKKLEQSRKNKILDYLPEYENFLRSHGY